MSKRDRKVLICLNDDEHALLDRLVDTYSSDGHKATKSFIVRYALKRLPHQAFLPFAAADSLATSKSAC